MSYAIVKTGGKQYRVEEGQTLLVEKLDGEAGDSVALEALAHLHQPLQRAGVHGEA